MIIIALETELVWMNGSWKFLKVMNLKSMAYISIQVRLLIVFSRLLRHRQNWVELISSVLYICSKMLAHRNPGSSEPETISPNELPVGEMFESYN